MVSLRLYEFIESKALIIYADVTRVITTHNLSISFTVHHVLVWNENRRVNFCKVVLNITETPIPLR